MKRKALLWRYLVFVKRKGGSQPQSGTVNWNVFNYVGALWRL